MAGMKAPAFTKTRPRIVINALHAKSGGGVTYLRNVLPYFAEHREAEFHLFLHEEQYDLFAPLPENIHLHLFDFRTTFLGLLMWEQVAMPVLARVMSADVTFSPANYGPLFAPRPVILLRNALSVAGGETRLRKRFYWLGVAVMTWLSMATSRKTIAVSAFARKELGFGIERFTGRPISVVYHGVDSAFRPNRRPDSENPFLLAVSDIYVQKNLHNLVAALPAVFERFPDLRLAVAGRPIDQDYFDDVRKRAEALGIADRIDYLGHCSTEELIDLYDRCTLLVFPSTVETFGNPLVEAMACGVPIATSNAAAMPEIAGDAAAYFDPASPRDIGRRLIELVENPERAQSLAAAGLRRAAQFSWSATVQKTCEILLEAAGPARNG